MQKKSQKAIVIVITGTPTEDVYYLEKLCAEIIGN